MSEKKTRDSLHVENAETEFRLRETPLVEPGKEIEWARQMPYHCSPFKPSGIRLEDAQGSEPVGWEFAEVKIGAVSQLPEPIPYAFLKEVLRRRHPIVLDTIQPSLYVTVRLKNRASEARSVVVVFEGKEI